MCSHSIRRESSASRSGTSSYNVRPSGPAWSLIWFFPDCCGWPPAFRHLLDNRAPRFESGEHSLLSAAPKPGYHLSHTRVASPIPKQRAPESAEQGAAASCRFGECQKSRTWSDALKISRAGIVPLILTLMVGSWLIGKSLPRHDHHDGDCFRTLENDDLQRHTTPECARELSGGDSNP